MASPSAYQRYRDDEDDADEVLRLLMERRTADELAPVAQTTRGGLEGDLEDDDTRIDARTRWLDGEGEVLAWA